MAEEMKKMMDAETQVETGGAGDAGATTGAAMAPTGDAAEVETAANERLNETAASIEMHNLLMKFGLEEVGAYELAQKLGIGSLNDLKMCTEDDLVGAGMKRIPARKLIAEITPKEAPAAPEKTATTVVQAPDYGAVLPMPPTDESWLSSLKAGGVLKVGEESYISAIRVVFAEQAGLYDLPEKLATAMEAYADESDEAVAPEFFQLRKQITRRNYSEIFEAIDGLDGTYVTERRRKEFLRRVKAELQPPIREASAVLNSWNEAYRASLADPSMIFSVLGGRGVLNQMNIPPFDAVHDASESLKDAINHVFRGMGGVVAAAMAYDARQISKILDNRRLPEMLGVANRDQMLKKLGANVSPNYVRQEANMVRFVLSYVRFSDNIAAGDEPNYLTALWQLGNQINWEAFGGSGDLRSLGGNTRL